MTRTRGYDDSLVTLAKRSFWGLCDQAVVSAASLVVIVLVARALMPGKFGEFVLAYTLLLIANGLQGAVVTQPHNVLGVSRVGVAYASYTASTAIGQLLLIAAVSLVFVVGLGGMELAGGDAAYLLVPLLAANAGWQFLEFTRRVLYTENRLGTALSVDLVGYGTYVFVLVWLSQAGALSGVAALYALGTTMMLGAALGGWRIRASLAGRWDRRVLATNWRFGRWLACAKGGFWLSSHLYVYLAALILGTHAAGVLKAAQIVLGPLNILLLFLDTTLPIWLARGREAGGLSVLRRRLRLAFLGTSPVIGAYCLAAAVLATPILTLFYGDEYRAYGTIVALFSVYYFVGYVATMLACSLMARERTKAVFVGNLGGALVGLMLGVPLIEVLEVSGAVTGMILSAGGLTVMLLLAHTRRNVSVRGPSCKQLVPEANQRMHDW